MEPNSVRTQEISDPTEKNQVNDDLNATPPVVEQMPEDFKNDFFKHKQKMKEAEARAAAAEERIKQFEEKENLAKGNYQKIIDTLKEENARLRSDIESGEKRRKLSKFEKRLKEKATELGFTKPDRIMNFISKEDMEVLKIDGDYNINEAGLDIAFANVKKEWGELFKPKNVTIADGVPKTNISNKEIKDVRSMTSEERAELVLKKIRG